MNADAGFALTMIARRSPARTLVREQYPSIPEQRYCALRSVRVFVSSQSVVPGFAFSARIRSPRPRAKLAQPPSEPIAAVAPTPASHSRRFMEFREGDSTTEHTEYTEQDKPRNTQRGKTC